MLGEQRSLAAESVCTHVGCGGGCAVCMLCVACTGGMSGVCACVWCIMLCTCVCVCMCGMYLFGVRVVCVGGGRSEEERTQREVATRSDSEKTRLRVRTLSSGHLGAPAGPEQWSTTGRRARWESPSGGCAGIGGGLVRGRGPIQRPRSQVKQDM